MNREELERILREGKVVSVEPIDSSRRGRKPKEPMVGSEGALTNASDTRAEDVDLRRAGRRQAARRARPRAATPSS